MYVKLRSKRRDLDLNIEKCIELKIYKKFNYFIFFKIENLKQWGKSIFLWIYFLLIFFFAENENVLIIKYNFCDF